MNPRPDARLGFPAPDASATRSALARPFTLENELDEVVDRWSARHSAPTAHLAPAHDADCDRCRRWTAGLAIQGTSEARVHALAAAVDGVVTRRFHELLELSFPGAAEAGWQVDLIEGVVSVHRVHRPVHPSTLRLADLHIELRDAYADLAQRTTRRLARHAPDLRPVAPSHRADDWFLSA